MGKYINPFTDFGFKKLFGEEANKDLLIDFLNQILDENYQIKILNYKKTEKLGYNDTERKAIFDLYCENEKGEKYIIELQKAKQKFFKDRSIFYSTFPIQEQAPTGDWTFELKAVFTIGILDFRFEDNDRDKVQVNVKLTDIETNEIFYDKLSFIYLQMANFNKTIDELETHYDKWLYLLKNLDKLEEIPLKFREKTFEKLFNLAEIASYGKVELSNYHDSLKAHNDLTNSLLNSKEEGRVEGKIEGKIEGKKEGIEEGEYNKTISMAKKMKTKGYSISEIAEVTDLSFEEIEKL
jgi:predicted transposase/invertase (TIGR01784 family)